MRRLSFRGQDSALSSDVCIESCSAVNCRCRGDIATISWGEDSWDLGASLNSGASRATLSCFAHLSPATLPPRRAPKHTHTSPSRRKEEMRLLVLPNSEALMRILDFANSPNAKQD